MLVSKCSTAPTTVFVLPLKDDGSPDVAGSYVRLPPPTDPAYFIRFSINGASSICRNGSLWTNIPGDDGSFEPDRFRQIRLETSFNQANLIDIPIRHPGAFSYYISYSPLPPFHFDPVEPAEETETDRFVINVEPRLTINNRFLPLDSLTIMSCLSKQMGSPASDWDGHLAGIQARGYNCVHFAPLNQRGQSDSPYSIFDQLQFDPAVFPKGVDDVAKLVSRMESKYGLLALCDVVWNHTAHNSDWLLDHPDAGYNVVTAPHLEAALELDEALAHYSRLLHSYGKPSDITSVDELLTVMEGVKSHCVSGIKLWEFYVCNRDSGTDAAMAVWQRDTADALRSRLGDEMADKIGDLVDRSLQDRALWFIDTGIVGKDRMGERFRRRCDPDKLALLVHMAVGSPSDGDDKAGAARETVSQLIDEVNLHFYREYDEDTAQIMEQTFNRVKYTRLDPDGPRTGPVTASNPLVEPYFTQLPRNKRTAAHDPRALALVNNGWIWAADAMRDHAGPDSKSYLRREVIVWGDCVKLRYGSGPADSPYLWDRMTKYTNLMAKLFHAFRIDNCHSTPMHVAAYLLNQARKTRPNLAVFAELFSGSEETDVLFVRSLNLNGLIREAMQSWSAQEMSRIVHRQSGRPIGSLDRHHVRHFHSHDHRRHDPEHRHHNEAVRIVAASEIRPLFFDCTHDNEPPAQKRDGRDTLPNAALVAMCACSTGSVMGYDEVYPALINLVTEKREYQSPYSDKPDRVSQSDQGIGSCKAIFNSIHHKMAELGYSESFVHHEREYITVHRVEPHSQDGYFCVAHTAYPGSGTTRGNLKPIELEAHSTKLIGAWSLQVDQSDETVKKVRDDKSTLRGLPSKLVSITGIDLDVSAAGTKIKFPESFGPGSVAIFSTTLPVVRDVAGKDGDIDMFVTTGAAQPFSEMSLVELNALLYRCEPEERDLSKGADGTYEIPGYGALVYCGLQGWWSALEPVVQLNQLGGPICGHLRAGNWMIDHILSRLDKLVATGQYNGLAGPTEWLRSRFDVVVKLPKFLQPRYFALTVRTAYHAAVDRNMALFPVSIGSAHSFVRQLSLVATQMTGLMTNASLWPEKLVPSMSAGLPHFASDWARCWGRDIFISLRGLLLCTGQFDCAREHILAFASVVKHGTIPNLLSAGKLPRYNSRDSVWFFLQAIQDYCSLSPEGTDFLRHPVKRRFLPYDDTWFPYDDSRAYSVTTTIEQVIHEILQRHAHGIHFREHNAGPDLDRQMSDRGFDIDVTVDWEDTGFVFGGNQSNCGTWMDKMGESEKAKSKGVPGTPRDGAAVEITGLLYSTLAWLSQLIETGEYSHDKVEKTKDGSKPSSTISLSEWADLIKSNFERCFFIPRSEDDDKNHDIDPTLVNRRGVYKDVYRSGKPYEDYQLRPNVQIAMTVAPDLFSLDRALYALYISDSVLRGPTGMATLDPSDLNYKPYYHNSDDSDDFATAKGRNYHQGPEWIWPLGYHLRALLRFVLVSIDYRVKQENWSTELRKAKRVEVFQHLHSRLEGCRRAISNCVNPWKGLTELTQKDGKYCADSSPTQAWSAACILDIFCDAGIFTAKEVLTYGE